MTITAIHQFHSAIDHGDGISNGMLYYQRLLRGLGFQSEIYARLIGPSMQDRVKPPEAFRDDGQSALLVHHSLGHYEDAFVTGTKVPKALIFHNITPTEFLPPVLADHARLGRHQLASWPRHFIASAGDSAFNAEELRALGYPEPMVLPILVDLEALARTRPDPDFLAALTNGNVVNILFVGRLVRNKAQDEIIRIFECLRRRLGRPARLLLIGGNSDDGYVKELDHLLDRLALRHAVLMPGKIDDARLAAAFRAADLFVSCSRHEGFGMPLIEAALHGVPVLARAAGSVPDTLGGGSLLFDDAALEEIAERALMLLTQPRLRAGVIAAQRRNLQRFDRATLLPGLIELLNRMGVSPAARPAAAARPGPVAVRIEGPFDSSYSLAIVNRETARALAASGTRTALLSREGAGPFEPDATFLAQDLAIAALAEQAGQPPDTVLRLCYPPTVRGMDGRLNILHAYAWEETGFSVDHVDELNLRLNGITTLSHFVAKVLRDAGVKLPIRVVGAGIDHLPQPDATALPDLPSKVRDAARRFLHVSSGFPRKGLDVLLAAWGQAFSGADPVALILRVPDNPHDDVAARLDRFRQSHRDSAPVHLIDGELPPAGLAALYALADVMVAPTRGEGFGLPIAEAMGAGLEVITTGHGGAMDFCGPDTAHLIDWAYAASTSHLATDGSLWAEPDVKHLTSLLQQLATPPDDGRTAMIEAARKTATGLTWQRVAARTMAAIEAFDSLPALDPSPRIALVSSWNARCGIAAYAAALSHRWPQDRLHVFACHDAVRTGEDDHLVTRCWTQGWDDPLAALYDAILGKHCEVAVIQVNFGFYDLTALGRLIDRLAEAGVELFLMFHATADVTLPERAISLAQITGPLAKARRLIVHGLADLDRLRALGLADRAMLLPQGVRPPRAANPLPTSGATIASFGYLLPDKGLVQLVEAFAALKPTHPDLRLSLLNARYPAPASHQAEADLRAAIEASGCADSITLELDYLAEEELLDRLGAADFIVLPYQNSRESSSAAVRMALAAGRPVAVTPLAVFEDVAPVTHRLDGTDPDAIATGIARLLAQRPLPAAASDDGRAWFAARDWDRLSERLHDLITGTMLDKLLPPEPAQ